MQEIFYVITWIVIWERDFTFGAKGSLKMYMLAFVAGGEEGCSVHPSLHIGHPCTICLSFCHTVTCLSSIHHLSIHPVPSPFFSPKLHTYIFSCLNPLSCSVMDSCSKIPRLNE